MKNRFVVSLLILLISDYAFSTPIEDGKIIFASRCASCHNVNKVVVGPALSGVSDRHSEEWIIRFVLSSQTVIRSGDKAAMELYEKFNKVAMPDHTDLTPDNIKNILAYIKSDTKISTGPVSFRPEKMHPSYTPILITNWQFFSGYLFLIVVLAAAMVVLVRIKEIRRKESDNE